MESILSKYSSLVVEASSEDVCKIICKHLKLIYESPHKTRAAISEQGLCGTNPPNTDVQTAKVMMEREVTLFDFNSLGIASSESRSSPIITSSTTTTTTSSSDNSGGTSSSSSSTQQIASPPTTSSKRKLEALEEDVKRLKASNEVLVGQLRAIITNDNVEPTPTINQISALQDKVKDLVIEGEVNKYVASRFGTLTTSSAAIQGEYEALKLISGSAMRNFIKNPSNPDANELVK